MVSATVTAPAREAVRGGPRFGLATATFVVVSSMIGTGVLTTSGFTVYFVGSNQLMLALWVVCVSKIIDAKSADSDQHI
jgi:hypothetical protein